MHTDLHVAGLVEATARVESILDNCDAYGILRTFGQKQAADDLLNWVEQMSAHRIQIGTQS